MDFSVSNILNITNGDSAVELMREGGIEGQILPWRDVLHDGPVPADLSLHQLSEVRAGFIASRGWGDLKQVRQSFAARDRLLSQAADFELVRLWFEHDLYDQLQLLQILDWWFTHDTGDTPLELVCSDRYLGEQTPAQIGAMLSLSKPVTAKELALANAAWTVFRYDTPDQFAELSRIDTSCLPFLHGTVVRLIEEYPDQENGLSKTEQRVLADLARGASTPRELFAANQRAEERVYMGDWSFWWILTDLMAGTHPLIGVKQGDGPVTADNYRQHLELTDDGRAVLDGEKSRVTFGFPERWIGGVRWTVEDWWNGQWTPQRLLD